MSQLDYFFEKGREVNILKIQSFDENFLLENKKIIIIQSRIFPNFYIIN